ncbi:HET-domain-containing protein, partial [Coniochaeta ligniaria NRRL 30616]
ELPTRLIEVGKAGDPKVQLRVTNPADTCSWVALSHRWGPEPHFCTTVGNLDGHLNGIKVKAVSATFRDAVMVTRALGCRYLWIDSLCIAQGDGGDFNEESKRMPQVYSGVYCVLAASRAANHYAGFLGPRRKKEVVALRQGGQPCFYISENIDDFNGHVLEGELNSRGWVLQEYALARRTVFFIDHQTYFECGQGVRCETMMTMRNDRAAFLGDPNFPQIIQKADQGEKILLYQDLYERYSRLGLSNDFDRPVAIDGLQARILAVLRSTTKGGFGVFDEGDERGLLRRSLLWQRAEHEPLARITFPSNWAISTVPSWSWMAYTGAIKYVSPHPPFGRVRWEALRSPWSGGTGGVKTETRAGDVALVGEGREYDPLRGYDGDQEDVDRELVFDVPGQSEQLKALCVVLGIQTGVPRNDGRCYVLLVKAAAESKDRKGEKIYERVGAGYL